MNSSLTTMMKQGPFWKYFDTPAYKKFDDSCTYFYDEITNDIKEAFKRIKDTKKDEDKPRDEWSILHKMMDRFREDSSIPPQLAIELI